MASPLRLLLLAVSGCGGATAGDASVIDGGEDPVDAPVVDAYAIDAVYGTVTVAVYGNGGPLAAEPVQYHASGGRYLGTVATGDDGIATITDFEQGGSVTVRRGPDGAWGNLSTILGLDLGDHVVLGTAERAAQVTVTTPPSGTAHALRVMCEHQWVTGDATPVTVFPALGCLPPGVSTFDVVAYDQPDPFGPDSRVGFSLAIDQPLTPSTPYITGSVTLGVYEPGLASHTVSIASAPGGVELRAGLWTFRDGLPFGRDSFASGTGSSLSVTDLYADGFFDATGASLQAGNWDQYERGTWSSVVVRTNAVATAAAPVTSTLDYADLPALINQPTIGVVDGLIHVRWNAPGGCRDNPGPADSVLVTLTAGTAEDGDTVWYFLAAGTEQGDLTFPDTDWYPFSGGSGTIVLTSDSALTWDDIRTGGAPFLAGREHPDTAGTRCTARWEQ